MLIFIAFYLLGTTADGYLSSSLEQVSKKLKISEQLAGVTFLAFANGSPDVIGAITAANSHNGGVKLAIGAILGAGLFITGVVSAFVILVSPKPIFISSWVFFWDIGFFMGAILILVFSGLWGSLNLFFSIGFIVWYIIYIAFVTIDDRKENW